MVDDSPEGNYALAHPTLGTIVFEVDEHGWATISLAALTSLVDAHDKLDAQLTEVGRVFGSVWDVVG